MKQRVGTLAVLFALCVMFGPGARPARATYQVVTYTVRYACIVSPSIYGEIEGEWVVDCYGQWSGYGWMPGHSCSYTVISWGDLCGDEQP
jgi:hypothetical protein